MWLQGVGRRSQIGAVGRGAHEVVDADDVLVVKVQEELDLPQRPLRRRAVLKHIGNLLDRASLRGVAPSHVRARWALHALVGEGGQGGPPHRHVLRQARALHASAECAKRCPSVCMCVPAPLHRAPSTRRQMSRNRQTFGSDRRRRPRTPSLGCLPTWFPARAPPPLPRPPCLAPSIQPALGICSFQGMISEKITKVAPPEAGIPGRRCWGRGGAAMR